MTPRGTAKSADPPRIYAIPAGVAFADSLARGLRARAGDDPLSLAAMTVLLPSRRAVRALTDAFLRVTEGRALLLPRLLALADLDGDQDVLSGADLPAAIDPLRRRLILARLVMARDRAFSNSPDQALRLAEPLAKLIDEAQTARLDFTKLAELAPENFAAHWQQTIEFLRVVTTYWPEILAQQGVIDPALRRTLALGQRAEAWRALPTQAVVVAAGFIAADPALTELISVVARLPAGYVVLPGLDRDLDPEGWEAVTATHPQWGLKQLLDGIGGSRDAVKLWPAVIQSDIDLAASRVRLLSEALRPAQTTARWRSGPAIDPKACDGLVRVDCETIGEEAAVIALAMREALETPGRTAALVTPDRSLARRVAAALARWGIAVDDSAGRPLGETPVGVWLRLIAEAAVGEFAPRLVLAMLKHPFAAGGAAPEVMRQNIRTLERLALRGPRPAPGLLGMRAALNETPLTAFDGDRAAKQAVLDWVDGLSVCLAPFVELVATGSARLSDLLMRHAEAAEALADTPAEAGGLRLWRGQDGEAAADLFARLEGPSESELPAIPADRYPAVLTALMAGVNIRPLYGAHPRLAIWGLIEARLQRADLMILGGLNEGSWPPLPGDEPWMSRPMRERFGLPSLEESIGAAAQDFALAASRAEVMLTRALRVDGAPTVPARFLSRLETLLAGSGLSLPRRAAASWRDWAEALDRPTSVTPCRRPGPRPPVAARPRAMSVTAVEQWMRDPYALYARRILKLDPLDPLDADPGAAERGQIIHHALDMFVRDYPGALPPDALGALLASGRKAFGGILGHPAVAAFWWPRFERVAAWFVEFERARRLDGVRPLATEVSGWIDIETAGAPFRLTAKADRIDRLADGRLAIIDYKTGRPPDPRLVRSGLAPQLPLEALIADQGGFTGVPAGETAELAFLRLGGGNPPGAFLPALGRDAPAAAIADAWVGLIKLIEAFDNPAKPYSALNRAEFAFPGDYDHLSRIDEWAAGS